MSKKNKKQSENTNINEEAKEPILKEETEAPIITDSSIKESVISEKRKENDKIILLFLVIVLILVLIYPIIRSFKETKHIKPVDTQVDIPSDEDNDNEEETDLPIDVDEDVDENDGEETDYSTEIYYIYGDKNEMYPSVIEKEFFLEENGYSSDKILGEYHCKEKDCSCSSYPNNTCATGNFALFHDGEQYVIYNYVTGEEKNIKFENYISGYKYSCDDYDEDEEDDETEHICGDYINFELVADSKLWGFVVNDGYYSEDCEEEKGTDGHYETAYYSLKKNKYTTEMTACRSLVVKEGYIISYNNLTKEEKFYDYDGNPLSPTTKILKRLDNTNFYYLSGIYGDYFYNKNGKPIFAGKLAKNYTSSKNNNLLVVKDNKLVEYNINEKVVYESEKYDDLLILKDGYIAAIDKDRMLKIIDNKENVIHEFEKVDKDIEIIYSEWEHGGVSSHGSKDGIEIYAGDYEYTYNPQTGESNKDDCSDCYATDYSKNSMQ